MGDTFGDGKGDERPVLTSASKALNAMSKTIHMIMHFFIMLSSLLGVKIAHHIASQLLQ